jgi:diacylglycerol O-acyltransferase 2, plant
MGTEVKADYSLAGVRFYSDGMTKDFQQGYLSTAVAIVTLMLYTGWMHVMLLLIVFCWVDKWVMATLLVLISTVFLPAKPVLWPAFNRLWVFKTWREYFHFSCLFETVLIPHKRYVFTEFPHGVFPMGPLVAGTLMQTLFPDWSIYSVAASSVFNIPMWRHFLSWIGSMPASPHNFKMLLRKGSVAVIVGGIAEMFMQHPFKERVKVRNRKGFVRMAIETGADGIVPVYHFGNSQTLDFGPESLSAFSRKIRASFGFLYGRWGLPLPRRVPILMVTGTPIEVPHMEKDHPDFDKTVDEVHAQVIQALQDLYDKYKAQYGWADRPLEIS